GRRKARQSGDAGPLLVGHQNRCINHLETFGVKKPVSRVGCRELVQDGSATTFMLIRDRQAACHAAERSLCLLSKAGATSSMNRAISSSTWACGFSPTLKYKMTSSKPAASTFFKVSVMRDESPSRTEFSVRSSGFTFCNRATISTKYL